METIVNGKLYFSFKDCFFVKSNFTDTNYFTIFLQTVDVVLVIFK